LKIGWRILVFDWGDEMSIKDVAETLKELPLGRP
jgi:hypothetical protein